MTIQQATITTSQEDRWVRQFDWKWLSPMMIMTIQQATFATSQEERWYCALLLNNQINLQSDQVVVNLAPEVLNVESTSSILLSIEIAILTSSTKFDDSHFPPPVNIITGELEPPPPPQTSKKKRHFLLEKPKLTSEASDKRKYAFTSVLLNAKSNLNLNAWNRTIGCMPPTCLQTEANLQLWLR